MKRYVIISFLLLMFLPNVHGQKGRNNIDTIKIDSALLVLTLRDSCTQWYFRFSTYDTIFLVKNQFVETLLQIDFSDEIGKTVIFISKEEIPPFSIYHLPRTWLEILLIRKNKKVIEVFIGRHGNNYACVVFKKKGRKYVSIECRIT